jgi:hypothetical protein
MPAFESKEEHFLPLETESWKTKDWNASAVHPRRCVELVDAVQDGKV